MKIIRNYAISVLVDIKDEDLISILLFLVQSLRYEGEGENDCKSNLFSFLLERAGKNLQVTTLLFWYLKAESETIINPKDSKQTKDMAEQNNLIYVRYL